MYNFNLLYLINILNIDMVSNVDMSSMKGYGSCNYSIIFKRHSKLIQSFSFFLFSFILTMIDPRLALSVMLSSLPF
jgi:hypothetical protein